MNIVGETEDEATYLERWFSLYTVTISYSESKSINGGSGILTTLRWKAQGWQRWYADLLSVSPELWASHKNVKMWLESICISCRAVTHYTEKQVGTILYQEERK